MLSVLMKLPLLSFTARFVPALLSKKEQGLVKVIMGKTQTINNQVTSHMIHEGTTRQSEIQAPLKLDTGVINTSEVNGSLRSKEVNMET